MIKPSLINADGYDNCAISCILAIAQPADRATVIKALSKASSLLEWEFLYFQEGNPADNVLRYELGALTPDMIVKIFGYLNTKAKILAKPVRRLADLEKVTIVGSCEFRQSGEGNCHFCKRTRTCRGPLHALVWDPSSKMLWDPTPMRCQAAFKPWTEYVDGRKMKWPNFTEYYDARYVQRQSVCWAVEVENVPARVDNSSRSVGQQLLPGSASAPNRLLPKERYPDRIDMDCDNIDFMLGA